jgi:hypothetical protein
MRRPAAAMEMELSSNEIHDASVSKRFLNQKNQLVPPGNVFKQR